MRCVIFSRSRSYDLRVEAGGILPRSAMIVARDAWDRCAAAALLIARVKRKGGGEVISKVRMYTCLPVGDQDGGIVVCVS